MGMAALRGDETETEVIVTAYGLEAGLAEFYRRMAGETPDREVSALLEKLAGMEDIHKDRLFGLYVELEGGAPDRDGFEAGTVTDAMEGGFTTETFIQKNRGAMQTPSEVLGMAMMLEAQGMDLYLRYAQKSQDPKAREVFYGLGEEEKVHLGLLGKLMDQKSASQ